MRYSYLDGLRGFAALMVLINHTFCFLDENAVFYPLPLFKLVAAGRLWVSVFFVLSGFVLSVEFLKKKDKKILYHMAIRRYPRLAIPVFVCTLIAYVLLASGLMYNVEAIHLLGTKWVGEFFRFTPVPTDIVTYPLYNVFFDYTSPRIYNSNLWTIPVEFMGSMLIFALLAVGSVAGKLRWVIYAVVVGVSCWQEWPGVAMIFGLMLAEMHVRLEQHKRWQWAIGLGVLAILFLTFRPHHNSFYTFDKTAVLIVLIATLCPPVQKLLSLPVSQFFGRMSFPLYLIHNAVICSLCCYVYVALKEQSHYSAAAVTYMMTAFTLASCILAARLFAPVETLAIRASRAFADAVMKRVYKGNVNYFVSTGGKAG